MKKMKKLIAFLLSLVMVVSLLPSVSFAADEQPPDPIVMSKKYDASTGYLTLTAYVTGETITTIEENPIPSDIVLVLDVSGSMGDPYNGVTGMVPTTGNFGSSTVTNKDYYYKDGNDYRKVGVETGLTKVFNRSYASSSLSNIAPNFTSTWSRFGEYYVAANGQYYPLYYKKSWLIVSFYSFAYYDGENYVETFNGRSYLDSYSISTIGAVYNQVVATSYHLYYDSANDERHYIGNEVTSQTATAYTGTLYYEAPVYNSKMDALKASVGAFVDEVDRQSYGPDGNPGTDDDVAHRISIVKFADDSFYNSSKASLAEGNHRFRVSLGDFRTTEYNYTEVVKGLTVVHGNTDSIKGSVNAIIAGGATASDYGMALAKALLDADKTDSTKVVVLFTDGEPNHATGFDPKVANDAITESHDLKSRSPAVKVYSIGLFDNPSQDILNYMEGVSSDYPNASAYNALGSRAAEGYFQNADEKVDLRSVFMSIATTTTSGGAVSTLSTSTILRDVCSEYFEVDADIDPARTIKVHTEEYDGNEKWVPVNDYGTYTAVISGDKKSVDVTGFDYSKYYVDTNDQSEDHLNANGVKGRRIVVEIPIKLAGAVPLADADKMANCDKYKIPTNSSTSGIYDDLDKDPLTPPELVIPFEIPTTEVEDYFTVVHCGSTVRDGKPESVNYAVTDSFDLTAAVTPGTLYGGTFNPPANGEDPTIPFNEKGKGIQEEENPMNFAPKVGVEYYLWEVSPDHLKPKNLCAYADVPNSNPRTYYVQDMYLLTAVDRNLYKNSGFVLSNSDVLSEIASYAQGESAVDVTNKIDEARIQVISDTKLYDKVTVSQRTSSGSVNSRSYSYYDLYSQQGPNTKGSKIAAYHLETVLDKPFYDYKDEDEPFYFRTFWTTCDGVVVFGASTRAAYYQSADGKSMVVTDEEDKRFWGMHEGQIIDDPEKYVGEDWLTAKDGVMTTQSSFDYNSPSNTGLLMMPLRTLLAAPKAPDEDPIDDPTDDPTDDPADPIDDPIDPKPIEYVEVFDNGTSYKVEINDGTIAIEPAGADGKLFAGWFTDEACTAPADLNALEDGDAVYAKYISDDYLAVKYTDSILLKKLNLISAIDSRDYAKTGYIIEIGGEKKVVTVSAYTKNYLLLSAKTLFGSSIAQNAPIMELELSLSGLKKNSEIKLTAFAVSKDGTEIFGETRTLVYTGYSVKG